MHLPRTLFLCALFPLALACDPQEPGPGAESTASSLQAAEQAQPLALRFQGAERIVVGTVHNVSAAFGRNEYGDLLILSTVTLGVQRGRDDAGGLGPAHAARR
jgi:hypothetical protein